MTFVREAMNPVGVTVGTGHTMREAARRMTDGRTGAAVVIDPELPAPGIVTERDVLHCVAAGNDLDSELVGAHLTAEVVYAAADWPLVRAAEQMTAGGFRHVLVTEGGELVGILSMRDIVQSWVRTGAVASGLVAG
ncbi:MAG TPA: CBS domain-containing protein [Solirubrobacteraceae bacterium]|jgi:signal-transduction protein with cAMP-binding, CBS, and nucleotidyltransferase domain|nr:CBS domain-containing protein [Solirubrobacteraceae bacterium]